jgi:hypothetical protein
MMRGSGLLVAAVAICAAPSTHIYAAEEQRVRVTGIFSNLAYSEEGGDLLGTEIFLITIGRLEYVAFFQCWGGEATRPVTVPVKVNGDMISFAVRGASCGDGAYSGRISKAGFDGAWTYRLLDGGSRAEPVHLKRKQSYWQ